MNWVSIDFGTSYSSATVIVDGQPVKVTPIGGALYGMYGFPTVAYVDEDSQIKVCNDAVPWRSVSPGRFIKDFKLAIHEGELAFLGVSYVDIITEILKTIKQSAEAALGGDTIEGVVLTIPAIYTNNDPRKQIMDEAAAAAGFKEMEFLREAEAAAIYYDSIQKEQADTITLIYDLGGGTFDPALIEHTAEGYIILGSKSGIECGGKHFDAALYRHFNKTYSFSNRYSNDEAIRNLQIDGIAKACRDIKEALSSRESVTYPVQQLSLSISFTRHELEQLIKSLLEKTFQECSDLIGSADKKWGDVSRILMIGGSTVIPCVRGFLREYLTGQNQPDIPILLNRSDEGVMVDTLFAVSIGGILYHQQHSQGNVVNGISHKAPPKVKKPEVKLPSNQINGHEFVDLGLSVKWATCNVGASSPSKYGDYFAWGETKTKSRYKKSNSITLRESMGDIAGVPKYDAASANWGGSWRLPTAAEIKELKAKCSHTWTSMDAINGMKVTGPNGNSIFLPAAGCCAGKSLERKGDCGCYWSSIPKDTGARKKAYRLYFRKGHFVRDGGYRRRGMSVRPVSE